MFNGSWLMFLLLEKIPECSMFPQSIASVISVLLVIYDYMDFYGGIFKKG